MITKTAAALAVALTVLAGAVPADERMIPIPAWFEVTLLDFRADVKEAAQAGKRVMIYFGQDGCPYCLRLMQVNFAQGDIAEQAQRALFAVALDLRGDRETVWFDGKVRTEKELAAYLKIQYTPTLLFLDEEARQVARVNGYYPANRFRAALAYVAGRKEREVSFADYMRSSVAPDASAMLHDDPMFAKAPWVLSRSDGRPLAVLFEQPHCEACDELHGTVLKQPATRKLLSRFDVVRLNLFGKEPLTGLDGRATDDVSLGRALAISYTPSVVFFDATRKEVFRIEGYVRALHFQSALDYVASGAYRTQPSFQRFLQRRADDLRKRGERVQIW